MKMNGKHELRAQIARRGLLLAALLALLLSLAPFSRAQSNSAPAASLNVKSAAAPAVDGQARANGNPAIADANEAAARREQSISKGSHEGITVHGHWTITVKNPDGSVASHNEFENALDSLQGATTLTGLLGGTFVPAGLQIMLDAGPNLTGGGGVCPHPSGNPITGISTSTACYIVDSRMSLLGSLGCSGPCSNNLAFSPTAAVSGAINGFTLSGSVTSTQAGAIGFVTTAITYCGAPPVVSSANPLSANPLEGGSGLALPLPQTPFQCGSPAGTLAGAQAGTATLTSRTLSTSIPVVASGQSVSVTVAITFSSGN
jgi:hypothetical protein